MTDLSATFRKPFADQLAAFRLRMGNLLPTAKWTDLQHNAHDRAFTVAGALKADLLADLAAAVEKAIEQGTTLETFRKDFREIVARHGWHGWTGEGSKAGFNWRTRVIYRTNMLTSYAAGRRAQLIDGKFDFWVYRHSGAEHPRLHHLDWDGVALPPDHPFWRTHSPPNGWGCGCRVHGARTEAGIRRVGGVPGKTLPEGWNRRDARSGLPPGIDKGWDYAPGETVSASIIAMRETLPRLPASLGADLALALPSRTDADLAAGFADFVDTTLASHARGEVFVVGALKPDWLAAAKAVGVVPQTAEIAVVDKDIAHAFRDAKNRPVDLAFYRSLPTFVGNPQAILADTSHSDGDAFIMIYPAPGGRAKLILRLDFKVKKRGVFNVVKTAGQLQDRDITALLGDPRITLIWGRL